MKDVRISGRYLSMRLVLAGMMFSLLQSCANVIAPTGGPEDTTPPQLDSIQSSPNFQTNFQKKPIKLVFDEWVVLNDVLNQVVVSPPLAKRPQISLKGKTVFIEFDEAEILRENATYTFNFGEAIKDLSAGNKATDLRFVFSTGAFIDSLKVKGALNDAFTGKPVEGALFMLYDNLSDTVVRTERPFYFARTDKNGLFEIENVRADTFKAFALVDANLNYLFDQPSEKIGFPLKPLIVSDSTQTIVSLRMFEEVQSIKVKNSNTRIFGKVAVNFNQAPDSVSWSYQDIGQEVYPQIAGDSLVLWYNTDQESTWKVFIQKDTLLQDTLTVKTPSKTKFLEDNALELFVPGKKSKTRAKAPVDQQKPVAKEKPVFQNPDKTLILTFNRPLRGVDTSYVRLSLDTLLPEKPPVLTIDSSDRKNLVVAFPWEESRVYDLTLFPGALTDWFGSSNDTILQPVSVKDRKAFGNIQLIVEDLRRDTAYFIELVNQGGLVIERFAVKGEEKFETIIKALSIGPYAVRLIEDLNQNGKWDPGAYDSQLQPEKIFIQTIEQLRANWDLEVKMSASIFNPKAEKPAPKKEE